MVMLMDGLQIILSNVLKRMDGKLFPQLMDMIQNKIASAVKKAQKKNKPTLIICKTIIGFGSPTSELS